MGRSTNQRGGRGGGRGGRGGPGRGNGKGNKSSKGGGGPKKPMFHPLTPGGHYVSYDEVLNAAIRQMYKTFNKYGGAVDIETTMRDLELVDFTKTKPNSANYKDKGDWKDDDAKGDFEFESEAWRKRESVYNTNLKTAGAMVHDTYCTETMQKRLRSRLEEAEIIDLIKLLPAIKALMHSVHKAEHPMKKIWTDIRKLLACKQGQHEANDVYINRLREHRDLIEARLGEHWMSMAVN